MLSVVLALARYIGQVLYSCNKVSSERFCLNKDICVVFLWLWQDILVRFCIPVIKFLVRDFV